MDAIYRSAAVGLPVLLGVLGCVVAFASPTTKMARASWVAAFAIVGVLAFVASLHEVESQDERLNEITGGDSFCYLRGTAVVRSNPRLVEVWVANQRAYTAHHCALAISPASSPGSGMAGYASFGVCRFDDVPPHSPAAFSCRTLPVGRYHIDSTAANGTVFEELEIAVVDGGLRNSIVVKKGSGEELLSTHGFVKDDWFGSR